MVNRRDYTAEKVEAARSVLIDLVRLRFASIEHSGPTHIANFEELTDEEARDLQIRDAFERVHYFLDRLGIKDR